jgi:hypothetical protein
MNSLSEDSETLTIAEVAKAARMSIPGIHWNIRHNKLKATFRFRQYHIAPADLAAFVLARARKA